MSQIAISQITSTLTGLTEDVDRLTTSQKNLYEALQNSQRMYEQLSRLAKALIALVRSGASQAQILQACKSIEDLLMRDNLGYLMLMNKVAMENRQFSMLSNIMKNKHDTAKNSINNIR